MEGVVENAEEYNDNRIFKLQLYIYILLFNM